MVGLDIRVFYMMNGMNFVAEYKDVTTDEYIIQNAIAIMLGPNKEVAMVNAFPYTDLDTDIHLNRSHITVVSDSTWNKRMITEYEKFWKTLRAKASGIVLAGQMPGNADQVLKNLKR